MCEALVHNMLSVSVHVSHLHFPTLQLPSCHPTRLFRRVAHNSQMHSLVALHRPLFVPCPLSSIRHDGLAKPRKEGEPSDHILVLHLRSHHTKLHLVR